MPMPQRVAAVDVGSNAIRFFVVESDGRPDFLVLADERFPVRLGHGVFSTGELEDQATEEACRRLKVAADRMRDLSVGRYRSVATSAVRDSRNRRSFVRRVREKTGLKLEVISGAEEMRLVHAAVRRRVAMGKEIWAMVELGGGSVEIALVDGSHVTWSETHSMGAVRLMEMFRRENSEPKEFSRLIQEYATTIRVPPKVAAREVKGLIATGGNIRHNRQDMRGAQTEAGPARGHRGGNA